jgi:hypothetical protein
MRLDNCGNIAETIYQHTLYMKLLLSFPRSGNHLLRFFIELLSEQPTLGVVGATLDIPLYKNKYAIPIPFNIQPDAETCNPESYYRKSHIPPKTYHDIEEMVFIIRNPRECLIRQNGFYSWNQNYNWYSYDAYFNLVNSYLNYPGKKCVFYYEDIITDRRDFVTQLYEFLGCNNPDKLQYVMDNIDELFKLCMNGEGRYWGGVKSNGNLNFYYPQIRVLIKDRFDTYLSDRLSEPNFRFIQEKYNIPLLETHQSSESKNS